MTSPAPSLAPSRTLKNLAVQALLGTDRTNQPASTPTDLLTRAAVASTRARAGWQGPSVSPSTTPCPPDPRPTAPPAALATLSRLLLDPDPTLIHEWADLALANNVRVSDSLAPALLDWWARNPRRSPAVFQSLSLRGPWLASHNPDWKRPVSTDEIPKDADSLWHSATGPERAALFLTIRKSNASRALTLLQSTWPTDGADDKRRFLEAFNTNLSPTDEPFLESALDDRAKSVRQQAAALLALIPSSHYRARMNQRLESMAHIDRKKSGLLRKESLTILIEPPAEFDQSWTRDAIDPQPPPGKGKRAWWFQQIASRSDPAFWCRITTLAPADLITALAKHEYYEEITTALFHSVLTSPSDDWIIALLHLHSARFKKARIQHSWWIEPNLLMRHMPRAHQESLALRILNDDTFDETARLDFHSAIPAPWSLDHSSSFLDAIKSLRCSFDQSHFHEQGLPASIGNAIHPSLAQPFEDWLRLRTPKALLENEHTGPFANATRRLRRRADMHKDFTK